VTGTAESPFAVTFKLKNSYISLTGLANIRWFTKTSGFHVVRPVVKLANGTLMVGDIVSSSVLKLTLSEFSLTNVRWIKLDRSRRHRQQRSCGGNRITKFVQIPT
jgi:hypothetical protein